MVKKICEMCGKEFEATRKNAMYCSKRCGEKKWRMLNTDIDKKTKETAKCIVCGNEFKKLRKDHVCCSKKCSQKKYKESTKIRGVRYRERQKEKKNAPKPESNHKRIADIAIAARNEGLTYGQYVAKYMGGI